MSSFCPSHGITMGPCLMCTESHTIENIAPYYQKHWSESKDSQTPFFQPNPIKSGTFCSHGAIKKFCAACTESNARVQFTLPQEDSEPNPVSPAHYKQGRAHEPWDVIIDWNLSYCLGSAVKYISRAGRKDSAVQDLRKAIAFIEREIKKLEEKK